MKKTEFIIGILLVTGLSMILMNACTQQKKEETNKAVVVSDVPLDSIPTVDTTKIPNDKFGASVRYGRELMLHTAELIGPNGSKGKYLGNQMNCTNCHQEAGTKAYSFNLMYSHENYPQYRAREGKVLTLAERVNNCVMRPHNGRPLPLNSDEMVAFLSYFKWINSFVPKGKHLKGAKNLEVEFPDVAADPQKGALIFEENCSRCHGKDGSGQWNAEKTTYVYPPLWGKSGYQPGSSMHRVIKQAQWLKANMPFDKVKPGVPFLTDQQCMDVAAFVNNDLIHDRPSPKSFDYPHKEEKAIDYDLAPFIDTFSAEQHKYGPYNPIIDYWKKNGWKPVY